MATSKQLARVSLLLLFCWLLSQVLGSFPADHDPILVELVPVQLVTVGFNDTVMFQCSVNDSDYLLHWSITYHSTPITGLEVDLSYNHTARSSLTLVVNMKELNQSTVSCGVQKQLDGPVFNSISCTILIHDQLPSVNNLYCNGTEGQCSWDQPYTLHGVSITHYTITATVNNSLIQNSTNTLNTSWRYCPRHNDELRYRDIEITVVPFDSLGTSGDPATTTLSLTPENSSLVQLSPLNMYKTSPSSVGINFKFTKQQQYLLHCVSVRAWLTDNHTNMSHNATLTNVLHDTGIIHTEFSGIQHSVWSMVLGLYLKDSLLTYTETTISTFDLQELIVLNPIHGRMCFQCLFISNSTVNGCLVTFSNLETGETNQSRILKPLADVNSVTGCVDGVKNGTYRIWANDIDAEPNSNILAIAKQDYSINGIITSISQAPTILTATSTTQVPTDSTGIPPDHEFDEMLLIYIIGPIVVISICGFVVVSISLISFRKFRKKKILEIVGNQVNRINSSLERNASSNGIRIPSYTVTEHTNGSSDDQQQPRQQPATGVVCHSCRVNTINNASDHIIPIRITLETVV